MNRLLTCLSVLAATAALSLPIIGVAEPIKPGFDLLKTKKGEIIVNGVTIPLQGIPFRENPLKKAPAQGLGNTDTIIQRKGGVDKKGSIPIELVALSLRSVKPIKLDAKGFFNTFVTLNPDSNSRGQLDITSHDDNNVKGTSTKQNKGGEFQIPFLGAFLQVDFIPIGGNTADPIRELVDTGLMSTGGSWSHEANSSYPTIPNLPAGNFYFDPFGITNGVFALSVLVPARVSEPLTLVLLGTGLLLIGVGRRSGRAG